jgi:hypothetical protein
MLADIFFSEALFQYPTLEFPPRLAPRILNMIDNIMLSSSPK